MRGIFSKTEMASFCNENGLVVGAVEVGVSVGNFANNNLEKWLGGIYYMVDNYLNADAEHEGTCKRLDQYIASGRAKMIRKSSWDAVIDFPDESLDWIYLDAAHDYPNVSVDIRVWWPKLRPGGLFSGHDWQLPDVRNAVEEFITVIDQEYFITNCVREAPSWYFLKRKP